MLDRTKSKLEELEKKHAQFSRSLVTARDKNEKAYLSKRLKDIEKKLTKLT